MTWEILGELIVNNRKHFAVRCSCGVEETRRQDHITTGRSKSCKRCSSKKTASEFPPPVRRTGCGGLSGTHYGAIKHGALRRGYEFTLTPEFLWKLFVDQDGKCAYTNRDLVLTRDIKNNNVDWDIITASVDRIDSDVGYTESNVQWVHKDINRFKNNYSHDTFIRMCHEVVHGNPEPSLENGK